MKKLILIAGMALLASCRPGGRGSALDTAAAPEFSVADWHSMDFIADSATIDSVAGVVESMHMRCLPYRSVEEIKKELGAISEMWDDSPDYKVKELWEAVLWARLEFHLQNPVTFREWEPSSEWDPLTVSASPDGKYKFYTTWDICTGTMGTWVTYCQTLDPDGNPVCRLWQDDREPECRGNVVDVWQFELHDTTFYVLKSLWKASSCEWGYGMEIVTFSGGTPTYHSRFFPEEESGESYGVCYTNNFLDIDYSFDPKTLTVTAETQADGRDKLTTKKWRLNTKQQ